MPRKRYQPIAENTFAHVIRAYLASTDFANLAKSTQDSYRRFLWLAEHPDTLGAVHVKVIRPSLVQGFLDGFADIPGSQKNAKTALKALEAWAVVRDLLPRQITLGVKTIKSDGGYVPWTEAQLAHAVEHAPEHLRRAVLLAGYTGQRGSDLIRMRWTDIEAIEGVPGIHVTQQKTKLKLWIPFAQTLQTAMASWERRPGFILLKRDGHPFACRKQLADQWDCERQRPEMAPCRDLVMHGLRGTAVVRLRRAGATISQIRDMIGMSEQMVKRYCRHSDQRQNALAAVHILDRTALEQAKAVARRKLD